MEMVESFNLKPKQVERTMLGRRIQDLGRRIMFECVHTFLLAHTISIIYSKAKSLHNLDRFSSSFLEFKLLGKLGEYFKFLYLPFV